MSSNPYQLGEFVAYDLDDVFNGNFTKNTRFENEELTICSDSFLESQEFIDYEIYRIKDREIDELLVNKNSIMHTEILEKYISLNPNIWSVYFKVGKYYYQKKNVHQGYVILSSCSR